jgi:hypothetical protein
VEQHPSPPKQHMQILPFGVIPKLTVFSIIVTERLSTVTVSPCFSCLKMGVPPDATNKTLSFSPLIFWRKHPKPAQQQVFNEQSRSHPAKMKMIHEKQEANGKKHSDNFVGSLVPSTVSSQGYFNIQSLIHACITTERVQG